MFFIWWFVVMYGDGIRIVGIFSVVILVIVVVFVCEIRVLMCGNLFGMFLMYGIILMLLLIGCFVSVFIMLL